MSSQSHDSVKHKTQEEAKSLFMLLIRASSSILFRSERTLERKIPGRAVRSPRLLRRTSAPARFPLLQRLSFLTKVCSKSAADATNIGRKPGVCPRWRFDFGHCAEFCSKDRDCPNNEKCCSNGCGHECMGPVIECPCHLNLDLSYKGCQDCPRDHICCVYAGEEVCVPPVSRKPGVCPRWRFAYGNCAESCSYDSDCPNNEKCCFNGCGHECTLPYIVKTDCPYNKKCCSNGCGCECMAPYIVKPGVCPRRHLGHRRCIESCFNDRDCPYIEKCCYNGCGHECMAPYKGWLLPSV
ncbi:WAP four-disulfide core domain protein 3 [Oreochromis niloticus]|uniref:WAP four-disulfide core domain protein 3 n=1 Tax=Oreochromis niloticus TaxID=8128 RepID=UPI000DF1F71B|nr:WAP four-disulfide core domain protein 3 [Oreochromis niloticus]